MPRQEWSGIVASASGSTRKQLRRIFSLSYALCAVVPTKGASDCLEKHCSASLCWCASKGTHFAEDARPDLNFHLESFMLHTGVIMFCVIAFTNESITKCVLPSLDGYCCSSQMQCSVDRRACDDVSFRQFGRESRRFLVPDKLDFFPRYQEYRKRAKKIAELGAELDEIGRKLIELRRDKTLSREEKEKLNSIYRQRIEEIERQFNNLSK
jgi:hypothetical protein